MPPYRFIFSDGILDLHNAGLKIWSTPCFVTAQLEIESVDTGEQGDGQSAQHEDQPRLASRSLGCFYQS